MDNKNELLKDSKGNQETLLSQKPPLQPKQKTFTILLIWDLSQCVGRFA